MPSKYKFKHGTGRGYQCTYMAIDISNRRTLSKYGRLLRLNLYFDGTRAYIVVARSFTDFGGSYAPVNINDILLSAF
jgi:hypothetical protein